MMSVLISSRIATVLSKTVLDDDTLRGPCANASATQDASARQIVARSSLPARNRRGEESFSMIVFKRELCSSCNWVKRKESVDMAG